MIKFVIDEDISRSTSNILERNDYSVLDIRDHYLRGCDDDVIFKFAQDNKAILLTGDLGFANILKFPLNSHYGIIVLHFPNEISTDQINKILISSLSSISESDFVGNLIIIEPNKIRIKRETTQKN